MTSLPPETFEDEEIALHIWFNDGVNGSQLLTPDQRLTSSAYAFNAATVADGAITSAKIGNNAITGAKVASNTLTSSDIAANATGTSELASNAVNTSNVLNGSLLGEDFAAGSITGSALANPLELGNSSQNGGLLVWSDAADQQTISLSGSESTIETSGLDGTVNVRMGGTQWGSFTLFDRTRANNNTASLVAYEQTVLPQISGPPIVLPNPGGGLLLGYEDERKVYLKAGTGGGYLSLFQIDGGVGFLADGDVGGGGQTTVYQADGQPGIRTDGVDNSIEVFQNADEAGVSISASTYGLINVYLNNTRSGVRAFPGSGSAILMGAGAYEELLIH